MIRDAIGALPPDAIAQVVRAYEDAFSEECRRPGTAYPDASRAGEAAFREALAAVLPQEAGAPPTPQPFDGSYPAGSAEEMLLRKLLWLRHGCRGDTVGLYGDDGALQCGTWMIDLLRMAPRDIER